MHGLETLMIHQGAMFFGLFIVVAISFIFFNAVVGKK